MRFFSGFLVSATLRRIPAMATSTVPATSARKSYWRTVLRLFSFLLLVVLLTVAIAALWFYRAAHSSLPQLDGSVSLSVQAPVKIVRDAHGVPHLTAANLN